MRLFNPYQNIFYYYRGFSVKDKNGIPDTQIEDNTTKALINTICYSDIKLLNNLLDCLKIKYPDVNEAKFDLQVYKDICKPDAAIYLDKLEIFIESKVHIPLTAVQLTNHLTMLSENGYLICITNRESDQTIVTSINDDRLRFTTWKNIYYNFEQSFKDLENQQSKFIIKQFLEYLENINMAPFTCWEKRDFEAFLNISEDPNIELRLRVKNKLNGFIEELYKTLIKNEVIKDHIFYTGYLNTIDYAIWGVIFKEDSNKVDIPHFNFLIGSDDFSLGIQIEGKKPALKSLKIFKNNREKFLNYLNELDGFVIRILERVELGIRKWKENDLVQIELNGKLNSDDIDYIIRKAQQIPYPEFRIAKFYKRDDKALQNPSFLQESTEIIKRLKKLYEFVLN